MNNKSIFQYLVEAIRYWRYQRKLQKDLKMNSNHGTIELFPIEKSNSIEADYTNIDRSQFSNSIPTVSQPQVQTQTQTQRVSLRTQIKEDIVNLVRDKKMNIHDLGHYLHWLRYVEAIISKQPNNEVPWSYHLPDFLKPESALPQTMALKQVIELINTRDTVYPKYLKTWVPNTELGLIIQDLEETFELFRVPAEDFCMTNNRIVSYSDATGEQKAAIPEGCVIATNRPSGYVLKQDLIKYKV